VKLLIFLYEVGWAMSVLQVHGELSGAELSTDPDRFPDAHLVVFDVPITPDVRRIREYPGQFWVAFSMESDVNYPSLSNLEYMRRFDLTMTYRRDSDIPVRIWAGISKCSTIRHHPRRPSLQRYILPRTPSTGAEGPSTFSS
jgi:hypothetical protein